MYHLKSRASTIPKSKMVMQNLVFCEIFNQTYSLSWNDPLAYVNLLNYIRHHLILLIDADSELFETYFVTIEWQQIPSG